MNKQNIAVIGAGIIGVNCAAELQELGYQVTLLDRIDVGEGCSKGNAGHFATEQVFPLADFSLLPQIPKMLFDPLGPISLRPAYLFKVLPWFLRFMFNMTASKRRMNTRALISLNRDAIACYQSRLANANGSHLLSLKGSLLVFENTALAQIQAHYQLYADAGVPVQLIDRQQALALEPNLSTSISHALYFTDVGHTCDPYQICQVIANYSKRLGAEFKQFNVKHIQHTEKGVMLSNGSEQLSFDKVVVASGVWSKYLLNKLDYQLPIEAERGYSLNLSQQSKHLIQRPIASAERRFIMTPMSHGLRLAGTVEFAGLDHPANMHRADKLYDNATHIVDQLPHFDSDCANEDQRWMGARPSLPDSLPVIGQAPEHEHIYLALGHQHLGLTLGAVTGKLIGQLITGQKPDVDLSPFCISRFN